MPEVRVRGSNFVDGIRYLRRVHGDEKMARLVAALQPEHAKLARDGLLSNLWYPWELYLDFWSSVERVYGTGDLSFVAGVSRALVDEQMATSFKPLMAVYGAPSQASQRTAVLWKRHFEGGELVELDDPRKLIRFELRDFPSPNAMHCTLVMAFVQRFLELTAKKKTPQKASHPSCRALGAPTCEFVFEPTS